MASDRYGHTATLLSDGKVLVSGGYNGSNLNTAEIYDPSNGTFSAISGSMVTARQNHTAVLLPNGKVLVSGGYNDSYLNTAEIYDPVAKTFTATGNMTIERQKHTATLLFNGKVLIIGGSNGGYLNTAEIYDPANGTFTATGNMTASRQNHTATLLPNGKVLIVGGSNGSYLFTAEIYDPADGTFTATGNMTTARQDHTATLLPNGKVFVAGGYNGLDLSTAEIYDPGIGTFSAVATMSAARYSHTATLLPSGKVLVSGGHGSAMNTSEIYDPAAGTFTATGNMSFGRYGHTATLLASGNVLFTGGSNGSYLNTAEIYDSTAGTFIVTGNMTNSRYWHTSTLLPNGKVLITGGIGSNSYTAEIYDPATGTFTATGNMLIGRYGHTATLLLNGKVLISGGYGSGWYTAEIYDPVTGTFTMTGNMSIGRYGHAATLLYDGMVLITGGDNINSQTTEIYNPVTGTFYITGSMATARFRHTATLLPGGKVLISGGYNYNSNSYLNSAEIYDVSAGTFTTTGTMASSRYGHTTTLLPNGNVLITGGYNGSTVLDKAEIYNPVAGTFTTTGNMAFGRNSHNATLLPSGKVLVTGGYNGSIDLNTAEIFDPAAGAFTATGNLITAREFSMSTLLPSGNVLVTGGYNGGSYLNAAELYDAGLGYTANRQSVISGITASSGKMVLSGTGFRGDSEGSSGNSNSSSSGLPILQLQRVEGGDLHILSPDPNSNWSSTSFTSTASSLSSLINGHYLISIIAGGVPGIPNIVSIAPAISYSPIGEKDFGSVTQGSLSTPQTFTITNSGLKYLNVSSIYISGTNPSQFFIVGDSCSNSTLTPGGTCSVNVYFRPNGVGTMNASVSIPSNAPSSGPATLINLTGISLASPVNGACGSANGGSFITAPESDLCAAGTPTTVSGSGPWTWSCTGLYDGTTADCSANIQTYTVSFVSGGNGSLSGTVSQTINAGAATSVVTAVPSTGYHFVNWTGTGGFVTTTTNPLTVANVAADLTITANFAPDTVNGVCGTSNGSSFALAPDSNLCTNGIPTSVTGSGPWTWSCTGINGGTTTDCSANITTASVSKVLVAGGMSSNSTAPPTAEVFDQATGTWSSTSNTIAYGTIPTDGICNANMTLLGSGKALIAGGSCGGDDGTTTNATSLYDPATNLWSTGALMAYGRNSFGLVTLPNGDALAFAGCAGGCSGPNVLWQYFWTVGGTAELYSSTNNSWVTKHPLNTARAGMGGQNSKTVALQDGKVLVCGGNDAFNTTYTSCEIYDPAADAWTTTAGAYPELYGPNGLVLLDTGKVLSVLNYSLGAVLFDPATGMWSATGAPLSIQTNAHLVKLGDGRVLMTGGFVNNSGTYDTLATAQIYDPTTGTWSATGSMGIGRYSHFAVLLGDGKVLAGGGVTGSTTSTWGLPVVSAEIFDPFTGLWSPTGSMSQPRWSNVNAVRLPPPADTTAPEVTFALPANASSTTVGITTLSATDNVAVTGYCLSETDSSSSCNWSSSAPSIYTFATDGIRTLFAFAKDASGNISPSVSATVNIQTEKFLTITKSGSGTGTVISSPAGINCGTTCSAPFLSGSAVVLFQTPDSNAGFSWWEDACSGTGDCAFSMSTDKGVTANFTSSPMVKNKRTGVAYSLLQTAYSEALHGDTIMALSTLPAAGLLLDAPKSLTIEGGYASDYASCNGLTPVFGPITVKVLTQVSGIAVRALQSSTKTITAFSFASPAVEGIIDEATHSITITVPSGTDVTALTPTITHTGASISPATGTPRDFTNPAVYSVTAEDSTTQAYTVTIQFMEPYALPTTATDVSLGANSVLVDGNRAYITEGTVFKVLDVSNPLSPVLLGSVNHGFTDLRVEAHAIFNNIVWCVRSSSGGYGEATYVFGVDVSDPANLVVRGTLTLQTSSSLLANVSLIYAGYLIVHDYSRNLIYVISISNPDAPTIYSSWPVPSMVNSGPGVMMIDGTLLYLNCRENYTFRIYNLADLTAVAQLGFVALPEDSSGPAIKIGSYVYISDGSGLRVIDVSNPATPSIAGSLAVSSGYLKSRHGKLFSFDLSTPTVRAYSLTNPIAPVLEASSTVAVPAPSTSLTLYPLSFPASDWVGNYLIGMTWGSAVQFNGARALNLTVN
ncbi:MAG: choice-of-anchor D domain-containing protein [Desulfobacteraceae bacterium]|nr:choice-of-anchor D domain-containing protein [Desulfobacteraceae bacterium]